MLVHTALSGKSKDLRRASFATCPITDEARDIGRATCLLHQFMSNHHQLLGGNVFNSRATPYLSPMPWLGSAIGLAAVLGRCEVSILDHALLRLLPGHPGHTNPQEEVEGFSDLARLSGLSRLKSASLCDLVETEITPCQQNAILCTYSATSAL